ncbi:unannotated protein [freshwater metagenome]|uniref:Unannotated protein n=1 Tax=freshwater metagenome TaxID=449393 RepID=A0A6J6VEL8_9ZZZZ
MQGIALVYRWFKPHKEVDINPASNINLVQIDEPDELRKLIKNGNPFEHLIIDASDSYKSRRIEIASKAYLK